MKEDSNRGNGVGRLSSVASALRLLKTFSGEEVEIGISGLAKRLGVAKSTAHRLATTLVSEGFLEQNPDNGRYHLGLTLFVLGAEMRNSMDISARLKPLLRSMRDSTDETIHLAVLDDTSIVYLHNLESRQAICIRSSCGTRKPAYCTSEGRVLLAYAPAETVARALKQKIPPRTPATITDPARLSQILAEVRTCGYAIDDQESEIGMRAIAVPIRDVSGEIVAATSLAAPAQRLTKSELRKLVPVMLAAAEKMSARLGYQAAGLPREVQPATGSRAWLRGELASAR